MPNGSCPCFLGAARGHTAGKSPQSWPQVQALQMTPFNLKASAIPGITRSPGEALLGRASGGTWKVFTFVEGLISVKDDRASASENHVCMGFFFFFFPANTQALKRSDTVQDRNHAQLQAGMLLWVNQVPGAKLSLDFGAFQFWFL